jgi:hypothetical protein
LFAHDTGIFKWEEYTMTHTIFTTILTSNDSLVTPHADWSCPRYGSMFGRIGREFRILKDACTRTDGAGDLLFNRAEGEQLKHVLSTLGENETIEIEVSGDLRDSDHFRITKGLIPEMKTLWIHKILKLESIQNLAMSF